jgi:hypothetical protein
VRILATVLVVLAAQGLASASSYQQVDGNIVDPIQKTSAVGGGDHSYSGTNLSPGANLVGAYLYSANLTAGYLTAANLTSANLNNANLTNAYLRYANLRYADLSNANLYVADLNYANLSNAIYNSNTLFTDGNTYTSTAFDYAGKGMVFVSSVPEPSAGLLLIGAVGLLRRRR